jgi:hypothetical protein
MVLKFPYRLAPAGQIIPSLPGRTVRPRPVVPITLIGPHGAQPFYGTLDTGADDTVFPETFAALVGVDLSGAPSCSAQGVGAPAVTLRYAEVVLQLSDGRDRRQWTSWVAFAPLKLPRALLGFAGFLQFFTATFSGDVEEVELEPNHLYPGI